MAFPKWLTPAGNLGVVPELDYYQFILDAYDENLFQFGGNITANSAVISGATSIDYLVIGQSITGTGIPIGATIVDVNPTGNLITISANATATSTSLVIKSIPITYSRVSGVLPEGIQIVPYGKLTGIPISTPRVGTDKNEKYTFSIRAKNIYTGNLTDRTFDLTITNVAPPIITPKTVINNIKLTLQGNITANIGDYLRQSISSANARIVTGVVNSSEIVVNYTSTSPAYTLGSGNLTVISANLILYPNVSVNAYPITSTVVSAVNTRDLGLYFDGSLIDLQLEAIEFANSATLTWTIKSGEIPPGLTLSTTGIISGYIEPIPTIGPTSDPDWDINAWDLIPWDASAGTISKNFSWTIEVSDGVNYDTCTYSMLVYPRRFFTADSTLIKVDATSANSVKLSVDTGSRHNPIILSTQDDLPAERERGYFSFKIDALDLDDDTLQYTVPALSSGAFDEQPLAGNSIAYVTDFLVNGNLFTGVFPKTSITTASTIELFLGNAVTANVGQFITQFGTGANARVLSNVTAVDSIPVTVISSASFTVGTGNLLLNGNSLIKSTFISGGWSNVYVVPAAITSSPLVTIDNTTPELISGDQIQVLESDPITPTASWYNGTVNNYTNVRVSGNTIISGNSGMWLTQAVSGANATIANISATTGTLSLGGNTLVGTLTITGDVVTANAGAFITQASSGANCTLTSNVLAAVTLPVIYTNGTFILGSGNLQVNGSNISAYPISLTASSQPEIFTALVGDTIVQPASGANATVITDQPGGTSVAVKFNSNVFTLGSGNLQVNGSNVKLYPTSVVTQTDIECRYNTSSVFKFNTSGATSLVYINGSNTFANPIKALSVGVNLGSLSTQGDIGYDESRFDQGTLQLPNGLNIDINSGWMTGYLPLQTINEIEYTFSIVVYKKDYPGYISNKQFTLTVLGDLDNTINWLTPSYLGTIENGDISDLFVEAISSKGKVLFYTLTPGAYQRLPQGLQLISTGIISGRVSFEVFCLDSNRTTIDSDTTTFDNTYTFNITASDIDRTISASRTFTIKVLQRNIIPYENLYLNALLSRFERSELQDILSNQSVFPLDLIYRNEDPFYGLAKDIKTLFLPGLNPSTLSHYANVVLTNHFTKRITFGDVKTAVAVANSYDVIEVNTGITIGTFEDNIGFIPTDFSLGYTPSTTLPAGTQLTNEHVKYEVVYVEIRDDNTNALGKGPADTINLTGVIDNPYYDLADNAYIIAYPNSFENMANVTINGPNAIGYINKGALPDWMVSKQPDGRVLGFTRAVVLAYTVPGASESISYRFKKAGFNLNELDFTVDRYQLDNNYSTNYDILANSYITSDETTFDRYPGLSTIFTSTGTVDYSVNISFEDINNRKVSDINLLGGLDGITSFTDGETLVFFIQEFATGTSLGDTYNLGWSDVNETWDEEPWDYDSGTPGNVGPITSDDIPWDAAIYVPGYNEYTLGTRYPNGSPGFPTSPSDGQITVVGGITYGFNSFTGLWEVANQRIGVWQVNINSEDIVTLTFVKSIRYYNSLYVRNGFTHGSTNIYFDPSVKSGKTIPNYSIIPQQINTINTRFDGGGTKFLTYRDSYSVPEQGDKYIKFAKNGVFT